MRLSFLILGLMLCNSTTAIADQHWRPTEIQQELQRLPRPDTLWLLGAMVRSTRIYGCRETSYRRIGLMPPDGELHYLIGCDDGEQYTAIIARDANGSTAVVSCSLLAMVNDSCEPMDAADYVKMQ